MSQRSDTPKESSVLILKLAFWLFCAFSGLTTLFLIGWLRLIGISSRASLQKSSSFLLRPSSVQYG